MKFEIYQTKFRDKAAQSGYSESNIQKCLNYAKPLLDKNLPIIYNTSHLSGLVGYNKLYLKRAADHTYYFYRYFSIPKKDGGCRTISEPLPSLKEIQYWILDELLYKIPVSRYAKAYVPRRTIKEHVKFHRNQPIVITLDIKNFFGTIKIESIERLFRSVGYSTLIANLLSKLTTLEGALPQGAPTSPYLSNIIFIHIDNIIQKLCNQRKIRYTRYADDMAFSGDFEPNTFIKSINAIITENGFILNKDKTMVMRRNQPQIITGILVNDKIQVPRGKRDELRQAVHFIEKYGLDEHLVKINCKKANYIKHLLGIANYILFINPKDEKVKGYKEILIKSSNIGNS